MSRIKNVLIGVATILTTVQSASAHLCEGQYTFNKDVLIGGSIHEDAPPGDLYGEICPKDLEIKEVNVPGYGELLASATTDAPGQYADDIIRLNFGAGIYHFPDPSPIYSGLILACPNLNGTLDETGGSASGSTRTLFSPKRSGKNQVSCDASSATIELQYSGKKNNYDIKCIYNRNDSAPKNPL